MMTDTKGAKFIRGLVKTVFIICYIAFMWASIHHVATYFNNFESGNGDWVGSYALAGAFDITALVTTIGAMFFRKSMPTWVFRVVWLFILAIAGYSFFINWEYASHYQNMDLILQPTGETTPVYDAAGQLHYVPVMRANTGLLWINPVLASGFTIFSLIYSIIAEFFGTKPPTTEELLAKKAYLEETSGLLSEIAALEGQDKKTSWVQRAKEVAKEVKDGAQELAGERKEKQDPQMVMLAKVVDFYRATPHLLTDEKHADSTELMIKNMLKLRKITEAKAWRIQAAEMLKLEQAKTPAAAVKTEEVDHEVQLANMEEAPVFDAGKNDEPIEAKQVDLPDEKTVSLDSQNDAASAPSSAGKTDGKTDQDEAEQQPSQPGKNGTQGKQDDARSDLSEDVLIVVERYPAVYTSWITRQVKSATIDEIVEVTKQPKRRVQYQVGRALITTPRNPKKILMDSILTWLKTAPIPEQMSGLGDLGSGGKDTEPLAKVDPLKEQEKEANNASQNGKHNGHKNGHHASESPLNLPELEVV